MESLVLLLVPILVSSLTQGVKSIQAVKLSSRKAVILRMFALTASLVGVIGISIAAGVEVPVTEIQTYVEALVVFATTQVPYFFGKQK